LHDLRKLLFLFDLLWGDLVVFLQDPENRQLIWKLFWNKDLSSSFVPLTVFGLVGDPRTFRVCAFRILGQGYASHRAVEKSLKRASGARARLSWPEEPTLKRRGVATLFHGPTRASACV
jgi:hypothetical protein